MKKHFPVIILVDPSMVNLTDLTQQLRPADIADFEDQVGLWKKDVIIVRISRKYWGWWKDDRHLPIRVVVAGGLARVVLRACGGLLSLLYSKIAEELCKEK